MRGNLQIVGVVVVLGVGYLAAQPFRRGPSQPTHSEPALPRAPLRWNEPVPLQVSSAHEASPASEAFRTPTQYEERPALGRIPQIHAGSDIVAVSAPPPSIATEYHDTAVSPGAQAPRQPVPRETLAGEPVRSTQPTAWSSPEPRVVQEPVGETRVASLPAREHPPDISSRTRSHRVVDGDSLPQLAERYLGSRNRYLEIYEANREILASPDLLPIGTVLTIPVLTAPAYGGQTSATPTALPSSPGFERAPTDSSSGNSPGLVPISRHYPSG